MGRRHEFLGEILVRRGLIDSAQLKAALREQKKTNEFLGHILIRKGRLSERGLLEALSEQFNAPVVSLKDVYIDWKLIKKFSGSLIFDYKCVPIKEDEASITFAVSNPLDTLAIKKAEEEALAFAFKVKLALAMKDDIEEVLTRYKYYVKSSILKKFE